MSARQSQAHAALVSGLRELASRPLARVIVWPQYDERDGGRRRMWTALALDAEGREVPLPGAVIRVANLLRLAFPLARWGRAQDYDATTGVLAEHVTRLPAALTAGGAR